MEKHHVTSKLKSIAKAKRTSYQNILTTFLIERAVARLVIEPALSKGLVFKGGFVALSLYGSSRFTTDLDGIAYRKSLDVVINDCKRALGRNLNDSVWFAYEAQQDLTAQGIYGGIRLKYRFGIGSLPDDIRRAQIFNLDIGAGDPVIPSEADVPQLISSEPITWLVYPIETIVAEKLHPLIALKRGNSRSKDIYDLAHMLPKVTPEKLSEAIVATFKYRNTAIPEKLSGFIADIDTTLLERGWASAVDGIDSNPTFRECLDKVVLWLESHRM